MRGAARAALATLAALAALPARSGAAQATVQGFAPSPGEKAFVELMDQAHHPLEAREAARAYVAGHPDSFLAC
jgi:hypothetical protein